MGMPFDEVALAGLGGEITEASQSDALELPLSGVPSRRQSIIGIIMALMEAWPQTSGPFFTADGQSATCQSQADG